MRNALPLQLETRDWLIVGRPWDPGPGFTSTPSTGLADNVPKGSSPDLQNLQSTEALTAMIRAFIQAGADLILLPSPGGSVARPIRSELSRHDADLVRMVAHLIREADDRSNSPVIIAGMIRPLGEIMAPMGTLTHGRAVDFFKEQADSLKDGGVDLLWLESVPAADEFIAAAEAFSHCDLPWCGSMAFRVARRTMMGVSPDDMVKLIDGLDHPPIAFGADCTGGISDLLRIVQELSAHGQEPPLMATINAIPLIPDTHRSRPNATPEMMADFAVTARDCGATLIGGGATTPLHLKAMREALETGPRGDRPTLDKITRMFGGLTPAADPLETGQVSQTRDDTGDH